MVVFGAPLEAEESILPISKERRTYGLLSMFLMFAGTQIAISFFVVGASTLRGVTVASALLAVLLGYGVIGGWLTSLIGRIGFSEGVPTMVAARPSFGVRGSILGVIITLVELGGWNAVHVALGGNALYLLLTILNLVPATPAWMLACVMFIGVLALVIASRGGIAIKNLALVVVPILFVVLIYITIVAAASKPWGEILAFQTEGTGNPLYIFDIMIISALTWAPLCADYSRLTKTRAAGTLGILAALLIVGTGMHGIGMISAAGVGEANPLNAMARIGGIAGFVALFTIVFATLTTAVMLLYSSSMSLINTVESFGGKGRLWWASLVIGVPCIVLACFIQVIYFVIPYLDLLGLALCPLFGVMLFDYYFLRRSKGFKTDDLYASGKGSYWGFKGFNVAGYTAWVVGAVAYELLMRFVKPMYPWVIVSVCTLLIAGVLYLILVKALPVERKVATGRGANL